MELLAREQWEWFVTLTFRDPVHGEAADKRFAEWIGRIQAERSRSGLMEQTGVAWARASERQRRGVLHFHVLLRNVGALEYRRVHELWKSNGFSWVESVRSLEQVIGYCVKYIVKGGEIEVGEGVQVGSRWPTRVFARSKLRRALSVLSADERERVIAWVLSDRRPSTRPDAEIERARRAGLRAGDAGRLEFAGNV